MSKKTETMDGVIEDTPLANPEGKTVEELKEIARTLQAQVNQYREMAVKAQGGLEVILQMIPKAEVEKMIASEANTSKNGDVVES
tara:strand:- start:126 stop:380 length:255 start_codon:yes stop_codon:yes gene_type:complete